MNLELENKTALITGSTAGIGLAIAASLVLYYSSPLSSATNGAAIRDDGGVVRSIL